MRFTLPAVFPSLVIVSLALPWSTRASDPGANSQTQKLLREAATVLLKEGNLRFSAGKPTHPSAEPERRVATATEGQAPLATVLSCADSRVPVELVFDRGVGEIFTVRVAGNVADTDEIATMEYGVGHLRTPLIVVLGHSQCGAVTAVVKGAEMHGLLPQLVDNIVPAADRAKTIGGDEHTVIANAVKENVWQSMADVLRRSSVIRTEVQSGAVRMLGAIYDLESGKIQWLGEHPNQKTMLNAWTAETVDRLPSQTKAVAAPAAAEETHAAEAQEPDTQEAPAGHAALAPAPTPAPTPKTSVASRPPPARPALH
ncbi:MAG: carbonic anhydrase [Verrucomicrobiales bacterium]|nr:carbonic anhydrase [Verrucomicrobiales bacterium]